MNGRRIVQLICFASILGVATVLAGRANGTDLPAVPLTGFGVPLPAVSQDANERASFAIGQLRFQLIRTLPQIGPLFNGVSCAECHSQPAIGGAGSLIREIRVRDNPQPTPVRSFAVDNLLRQGPQSQGGTPIFPGGVPAEPLGCQLTAPGCQLSPCQTEEAAKTTFTPSLPTCDPTSADFAAGGNCTAGRVTPPLFGLGLVEAVADATFEQIVQRQPPDVRGTIRLVNEHDVERVARFGWKDEHATLRAFAADAYLNEMGITSPDEPAEVSNCALGQEQFGVALQVNDDPEDFTGTDGRADLDRFTDFMRALRPPPTLGSPLGSTGAVLFRKLGCHACHRPNLTTAANPASFLPPTTGGVPISSALNAALASVTFHPYSDFLLHDMGALGDGMTSGTAGPTMMRTAPLWGLRARSRLLHDGRAGTIAEAIGLHAGQGAAAAAAFQALSAAEQQQVIDFLSSI